MTLNVTSPGWATTKLAAKTPSKLASGPAPAWTPLPWATMLPAKLPTASVVTSVNGTLCGPTPDTLCVTVLVGGLKLIVGNACWKAAVSPGLAINVVGVELSAKKFP